MVQLKQNKLIMDFKEEELVGNNGGLGVINTNRTISQAISLYKENMERYNEWILDCEEKLSLLNKMSQPDTLEVLKNISEYAEVVLSEESYEVGRSDQRSTVKYNLATITIKDGVYLDDSQIEAIKFIYYLQGIKKFVVIGRFF
jgi:hypothetical protein